MTNCTQMCRQNVKHFYFLHFAFVDYDNRVKPTRGHKIMFDISKEIIHNNHHLLHHLQNMTRGPAMYFVCRYLYPVFFRHLHHNLQKG